MRGDAQKTPCRKYKNHQPAPSTPPNGRYVAVRFTMHSPAISPFSFSSYVLDSSCLLYTSPSPRD